MALPPDLVFSDPSDATPATHTMADIIAAWKVAIDGTPDWEVIPGESAADIIHAKPVAGSPNEDLRLLMYGNGGDAPTALAPGQAVANNHVFAGFHAFGGGATLGDPEVATAATLYTGGTALQNAFRGVARMRNTAVSGDGFMTTVRCISTPESIMLLGRDTTDLTHLFAYGGAIYSPFVDGSGGSDNQRIYGGWVSANVNNAFDGIRADTLNVFNTLGGGIFHSNNSGANEVDFFVRDPVAEATFKGVARYQEAIMTAATSHVDDFDQANFMRLGCYYNSGPHNHKFGFLRNIYPFDSGLSNRVITSAGGMAIVGRTLGRLEAGACDCFLLGRTV